ncbi:acyl-CoA thioesterase [Pseudokineococcus sp. 1T1Z-3]|uniref:acyl-CoA thioesterase n=1 Tax=Pseudokineococcus sp. 1T1Z-3 TaxID=3132745 RepID=UPI0030A725BA
MPAREVLVPLRWSDMDAYGHVNNVQYVRLMEDARILGFRFRSGETTSDAPGRTGTIVARNEVEYLAPLEYQYEPVTVRFWASRLSGASFDLGYEIRGRAGDAPGGGATLRPDAEGWVVYARAESTIVLVDLGTGRPRRMTPQEKTMLEDMSGPPVELRRRQREQATG